MSTRRASDRDNLWPMWAMLLLVVAFLGFDSFGRGLPPGLVRSRIFIGLPATLAFGLTARWLRGVTTPGAVAGWAVAFILWLAGDWQLFVLLLCVFVLTFAATRLGYRRKQQLGLAERRGGRNAAQVVANVGAAALIAVIAPPYWMVGAVAVLCEATADTISSEIGQAFGGTPRLITNFRKVDAGTDGGITIAGSICGIVGALIIAIAALLLGAVGHSTWERADMIFASIAAIAGIAGMFFDSFLGATLERRGFMNNDQVNGASTVFAAFLAAFAIYFVTRY